VNTARSEAARPDAPATEARRAEPRRAEPTVPPTPEVRRELTASEGMAQTLEYLQLAYARRDAGMVKELWPSVDARALARAFDSLRVQKLSFEACETRPQTGTGEIECRGETTYVPRVGAPYPRTESRQWRFRMERQGESWVIDSVTVR
jgi:hypothetical protein